MEQTARKQSINLVGAYAGLLAMTEIGLGGILHASRIPLRGQLLSLNQIFLLMRASSESVRSNSRLLPLAISSIAAVLKSLGPIGNKLTPMLAISMQGLLFNIGIIVFGHTVLGRIFGGVLASLWAFAQPIIIYGLILGKNGERALAIGLKELHHLTPLTEEFLLYILLGIVALKVLIVMTMGMIVTRLPESWLAAYTRKLSSFMSSVETNTQSKKSAIRGALKQLCKPFFLVSIGLTGLLLFLAESDYVALTVHILQPLAIGFLIFFGIRLLPLDRIAKRLEKNTSNTLSQAMCLALDRVRNMSLH